MKARYDGLDFPDRPASLAEVLEREPLIRPVLRQWPEDKAEAEAHERALPAPSWEAP